MTCKKSDAMPKTIKHGLDALPNEIKRCIISQLLQV